MQKQGRAAARHAQEDMFDRLLGQFQSLFESAGEKTAAAFDSALDAACSTLVTAGEIGAGYAVAVVFGVGVALLSSWSRMVEQAVMPLMISLNMIPKVALGPLIIVWFKYGVFPNSMMAFSIAVFP